jgi:hypothetical protein
MKKPNNQTAEVLFELIEKEKVSRLMFLKNTGILNVADLRIRHGIPIKCEKVKTTNKHGRVITYGVWSLENIDLEKYNKINK